MSRLLLVDDDPEQLRLRSLYLEHHGHQVETAPDHASAVGRVQRDVPDCLIMDFRLPRPEDGRALVEAIREAEPALPIIVLTGWPKDVENTMCSEKVNQVLRKPVRGEALLRAITRLATPVVLMLLMLCVHADAAERNLPGKAELTVNEGDGESIVYVEAAGAVVDWATPGSEGLLIDIKVDGTYRASVMCTSTNCPHNVLLGALPPGHHTVEAVRNERYSAPDASCRRINVLPAPIPPQLGQPKEIIANSPYLYARANTVGKFTDVPRLMYATQSMEDGLKVLEYTVIFTNEDGGTSTRDLMARWGRATDIEYVYRVWLKPDGSIAKTLIQARGHKDIPYNGKYEGQHPLLQPVTDNNMVEAAQGPSPAPIRYQFVPDFIDLSAGSRELAMDLDPKAYAVAAAELKREGKLREYGTVDGRKISDPRNYAVIELKTTLQNGAYQVLLHRRTQNTWVSNTVGLAYNFIPRSGWVRVAIELPPQTSLNELDQMAVQCMVAEPSKQESGSCRIDHVNGVFFPSATPNVRAWPEEKFVTLQAGEMAVFELKH